MARSLVLVLVVAACGGKAKPEPAPPAAAATAKAAPAAPTGPMWWCAGGAACAVERAKCEGDCKPFDSVSCHQAKAGGDASSRCFSSWQACDDDRRGAADANARTDCVRGGPPTPAMAAVSAPVADNTPPKGQGWWCFTTVPMNAECVREKDHCTKDADEMRSYSSATQVSECSVHATVWCHQFADDEDAHPLCYPSPAYCENGRKIMSGGTGAGQTPCVTSN